MARLEDIIEKVSSYNSTADLNIIRKAYVFSGVVHQGQTRISGEPYLNHPIEVAEILTSLKMDPPTVATALLHDTVEDTHTTIDKIEEVFGDEIAEMVDGLTKLSKITFEKKADRDAENFRKMILAMGRDMRVILIKLADRLHNMRTLGVMKPQKQREIAQETLEIYAPLANRIGIGWMKTELEELSFKYLHPEQYKWIQERLNEGWDNRKAYVGNVISIIEGKLKDHNIEGNVTGRPKHLFSIYKKMMEREVEFENINDMLAFRIIVDDIKDCYGVLGIIHSTWRPLPGRFKDYVAMPKANLYQSLHTTVIGPEGQRMEVQIRSDEMHKVAEEGIAAHWKYKEGRIDSSDDERFAWLRQLLEWQHDLEDSSEFMEIVKVDLFPDEVFVFTPNGDVKELHVDSTPVDFAYSIHTDIGHTCVGAKVNGKMVPLKYRLRNGDVIDIITSKDHEPSSDWLSFVSTSRARTRIKARLKAKERESVIALGKEIIEKELTRYELNYKQLLKDGDLERIAVEEFSLKDVDALIVSIGYGNISVLQVASKILSPVELKKIVGQKASRLKKVFDRFKPSSKKSVKEGVIIEGIDNILVRFAKCCHPLPGDDISGYITQGQGITIHTASCKNLHHIDFERQVDVTWDSEHKSTRPVKVQVVSRNEKGLLAGMTNAITDCDANISSADIKTSIDNKAICTFEVEVNSAAQLECIKKALRKIKKVLTVERL